MKKVHQHGHFFAREMKHALFAALIDPLHTNDERRCTMEASANLVIAAVVDVGKEWDTRDRKHEAGGTRQRA